MIPGSEVTQRSRFERVSRNIEVRFVLNSQRLVHFVSVSNQVHASISAHRSRFNSVDPFRPIGCYPSV